ncbi:Abi family protein [Bradyrhizobium sp. HKCCYLS3077]|uniref:Abi family protein n=1 Tax=Bradyrhizobium sp. HKCCYLS3077 TaxID=3420761 RepID=UPI003EBB5C3A
MVGFSFFRATILARIPFAKPALSLEEQAILLAARGLVFENWADSITHLQHIGYYRFTGYLHPFKIGAGGAEYYRPGTTFELVHDRYIFDRKLRMIVLEAVEKIEIAARSAISNSVGTKHGPHWYLNRANFAKPNWYARRGFTIEDWHTRFLTDIESQITRSRDVFIKHYFDKYSDPALPPCWMLFEVLSFGTISECLKFLKHPEHSEICKRFGLSHQILSSWLHTVSYIRNICAHHSRLWNRVLTIKPTIPNARRAQFNGENDRIYAALLAMQILLTAVWETNHWAEALRSLVDAHPAVPLASMGFPPNWKDRKEWRF